MKGDHEVIESLFQITDNERRTLEILCQDNPVSLDHEIPDSLKLEKCHFWINWKESHNIIIYQFWEDDRFSVRNVSGIEIDPIELKSILSSILKSEQEKKHLARAENSKDGRFKSVTNNVGSVDPRAVQEIWEKHRPDISLQVRKDRFNAASTEIHQEIKGLSLEQVIEYQYFLEQKAKLCRDIIVDMMAQNNKKLGQELARLHANQDGRRRKNDRKSGQAKPGKKESVTTKSGKVIHRPRTKTDKVLNKLDIDKSRFEAFLAANPDLKSKLKTEKVSTQETSYGAKES